MNIFNCKMYRSFFYCTTLAECNPPVLSKKGVYILSDGAASCCRTSALDPDESCPKSTNPGILLLPAISSFLMRHRHMESTGNGCSHPVYLQGHSVTSCWNLMDLNIRRCSCRMLNGTSSILEMAGGGTTTVHYVLFLVVLPPICFRSICADQLAKYVPLVAL